MCILLLFLLREQGPSAAASTAHNASHASSHTPLHLKRFVPGMASALVAHHRGSSSDHFSQFFFNPLVDF